MRLKFRRPACGVSAYAPDVDARETVSLHAGRGKLNEREMLCMTSFVPCACGYEMPVNDFGRLDDVKAVKGFAKILSGLKAETTQLRKLYKAACADAVKDLRNGYKYSVPGHIQLAIGQVLRETYSKCLRGSQNG